MGLQIIDLGWATTVQDSGRVGAAAFGVPRAGPVDRLAHGLANRLVGNLPGAAALETAGGLRIVARTALIVATSADGQRHTLAAGDDLVVAPPPEGRWGYLAIRGGLVMPSVLGSCSHDTLSGLGPDPLVSGQELPVGPDPGSRMPTDLAPPRRHHDPIRVWPGPRDPEARDLLIEMTWVVKQEVSRVGVRLAPGSLRTPTATDSVGLPGSGGSSGSGGSGGASEGLVEGAVQLTPSGEPIIMLANHPTTGGYPVIAVVDPDDLGIIAQSPPGTSLRFRPL